MRNCRKHKKSKNYLKNSPVAAKIKGRPNWHYREVFPLNKLKRIIALVLGGITGLMIVPAAVSLSLSVDAATFDDINAPEVFAM